MDNILIISYGMVGQDGPLKNLLTIFSQIGQINLVAFKAVNTNDKDYAYCTELVKRSERNTFKSLIDKIED